jgi:hypothetical protein
VSLYNPRLGNKVRPVLNVSEPSGNSFNDNVDRRRVERVVMDTARSFSYKILRAGKSARLDKTDVKDAFKNVPAKTEELRLQGFMVENRYFIELRMIFGARTALAHYDILGNTIEKLAIAESGIPRQFVGRAVDDQPVATPANSTWGKKFTDSYRRICNEVNMELAEDCKDCDKAFSNTTRGKVLGIWFDSEMLSWKLPKEKALTTRVMINELVSKDNVFLDKLQSLLGRLNFVCMMCPFLKAFRFNMNKELASRILDPTLCSKLSDNAKDDLLMHERFLSDNGWCPIAREPTGPPPSAVYFVSDAAGLPNNATLMEPIGFGVVGFDYMGSMVHADQYFWPKDFITHAKDGDGVRFGNKSTTLEWIGLLTPMLTVPELISGRHVILRVDNIACVYGYENGQLKNDESASIMIRTAKLVSAYLGSVVHVEHVPRRSCWEAELVDNLSRSSTSGFLEQRALSRFSHRELPEVLVNWLYTPSSDWSLPLKLLEHVQNILNK